MSFVDRFVELERRVAEAERRARNRRRTGTVKEVDHGNGLYRVKLGEQDGKEYLTPWIRPKQPAGAGTVKLDVLLAVGEQVDVVSESGDLTDAMIEGSAYSEANPRENSDTPLHIKIGGTVFKVSGDKVVITAGTIVLEGDVHLGGEGGALVHRKGDVDSDGDAAVGSSSKVYAL